MANLARAGRLLDRVGLRDVNYASALGSFANALQTAQLFEAAAEAYERLTDLWAASPGPNFANSDELSYMTMLLAWGLRLDHLGHTGEATLRLRRSGAIAERWIARYTARGALGQIHDLFAPRAVVLAQQGNGGEAGKRAGGGPRPPRAQEHY